MKKNLIGLMAAATLTLLSLSAQAQFNSLHNFDYTNGGTPKSNVVIKGNLVIGTASGGGAYGGGVIYRMGTDGSNYSVLYNFGSNPTDGTYPQGTLVLKGKTIYGTTFYGGQYANGTLYKIGLTGTGYSIVHSFVGGTDLSTGFGGLTLVGKTLYGACAYGGTYMGGGLFSISTNGSNYQILHSFGGAEDGSLPTSDLLVKGTTMYGVTYLGGPNNGGTVYRINTDGSGYNLIWFFNYNDMVEGFYPNGGLVLKGKLLYGTTSAGGPYSSGHIYYINTTNSSGGTIHNFGASGDGYSPAGDIVLIGKTLYGVTEYGGAYGFGSLFEIGTNGINYAVLHKLTSADGDTPSRTLAASGLALYGVTPEGGANGFGTLFQYIL